MAEMRRKSAKPPKQASAHEKLSYRHRWAPPNENEWPGGGTSESDLPIWRCCCRQSGMVSSTTGRASGPFRCGTNSISSIGRRCKWVHRHRRGSAEAASGRRPDYYGGYRLEELHLGAPGQLHQGSAGENCLGTDQTDPDNILGSDPPQPTDDIKIRVSPRWADIQDALGISLGALARLQSPRARIVEPVIFPEPSPGPDYRDAFVIMPFKKEMRPIYDDHIVSACQELSLSVGKGGRLLQGARGNGGCLGGYSTRKGHSGRLHREKPERVL